MPTIAEYLGTYATTLKYEDLPAEVVHQAKRLVLDTVGCAFGGYDSEPARIARDMAADEVFAADPQVTLLGMLAIELVRGGLVEQGRAHGQGVRRAGGPLVGEGGRRGEHRDEHGGTGSGQQSGTTQGRLRF